MSDQRENYVYLAMTANGWGSAKTRHAAIERCRRHMGTEHVERYGYVLYCVHPKFRIDGVDGTLYTPEGEPPIVVKDAMKGKRTAKRSSFKVGDRVHVSDASDVVYVITELDGYRCMIRQDGIAANGKPYAAQPFDTSLLMAKAK